MASRTKQARNNFCEKDHIIGKLHMRRIQSRVGWNGIFANANANDNAYSTSNDAEQANNAQLCDQIVAVSLP